MPGATPLGLRYPLQGETVDATSWQNLAEDIDTLMTQLDGLRDANLRPITASVTGSGGSAVTATGVDGVLTYNLESWDTANLANLGVNNDRLTLSTGIWFARANTSFLSGTGAITFTRTGLLLGGVLWQSMEMSTATSVTGNMVATGCLVVTVAGTILQQRVRWNGAGGPGTWSGGTLQVYKIRELADI